MKIKELKIKGIRGIKEEIVLNLNQKSLLLFGDNGSGKSSITDAIEWFYHDRVRNLSNEEIDRKGYCQVFYANSFRAFILNGFHGS
jgi:DNA repair exonuclease SbcCD ATPase subunit